MDSDTPDGRNPSTYQDIVERLRAEGKDTFRRHYSLGMWRLCAEAADEIERLRQALKPFADLSMLFGVNWEDGDTDWPNDFATVRNITVGDLRNARKALSRARGASQ